MMVLTLAMGAVGAAPRLSVAATAGTGEAEQPAVAIPLAASALPVDGLSIAWVHESPVLQWGDADAWVTQWQTLLNDWLAAAHPGDTFRLAEDGTFGPLTDSASRALQAAQGLPVDGIVGPTTRAGLLSAPALAASAPGLTSGAGVIELGAVGADVSDWQSQLNQWLDATTSADQRLAVDGIFGALTDALTRDFQVSEQIPVDGAVGTQTLAAMLSTPPLANRVPGQVVPALQPAATKTPADATQPAAGICPRATADPVTITLAVDVPQPRCVAVSSTQRLRLVNDATQITVQFGPFSADLAPGQTVIFDRPFGDYLDPGVHLVTTSTYGGSGPEVWLRP